MSRITATLGRKVWYYPCKKTVDAALVNMTDDVPYDATVIYAWPVSEDGRTQLLNLFVIDHVGATSARTSVPLIQEDDPVPNIGGYAQWMPYQVSAANPTTSGLPVTNVIAQQQDAPAVVATLESSDASASANQTSPTPEVPAGVPVAPTDDGSTYASDFSGALTALRHGHKVARDGWNGKGMFVFLVPGSTFAVNRAPLLGIFPEGTQIDYNPHIDIKGANGSISTWVPSIGDVLAQDWVVVS